MLELSDYDENEEAHKSSNVECVEVNNGIKMANKRSKSLEKEEADDVKRTTNELLKRPDTAPPLLPDSKANKEIDESLSLSHLTEHQIIKDKRLKLDLKADANVDFLSDDRHLITPQTWHEHVYRKPPKMPTPFSIIDILWGSEKRTATSNPSRLELNSDNNNNSSRSYQNVEPSTLQQLLNLNIKTPSPRSYEHSNSRSSHNGIKHRGMSLSETSEDESIASDQPLNLCVIKSRDSSPGVDKLSGKTKKGATHSFTFELNSICIRFVSRGTFWKLCHVIFWMDRLKPPTSMDFVEIRRRAHVVLSVVDVFLWGQGN